MTVGELAIIVILMILTYYVIMMGNILNGIKDRLDTLGRSRSKGIEDTLKTINNNLVETLRHLNFINGRKSTDNQ